MTTTHTPDTCPHWAADSFNAELASELAAMSPKDTLLGVATTATTKAVGCRRYWANELGCTVCALVALRRGYPRKRAAYAIFVQGAYPGSQRRIYTKGPVQL